MKAAAGNYRVRPSSPCVNAGVTQSWMSAGVDLDNYPRIDRFYGRVDIGAYEYRPTGTWLRMK